MELSEAIDLYFSKSAEIASCTDQPSNLSPYDSEIGAWRFENCNGDLARVYDCGRVVFGEYSEGELQRQIDEDGEQIDGTENGQKCFQMDA